MSTLRPICVKCHLEMRCVKNNRLVQDPATTTLRSTYWFGDEYECPRCGVRVVTGFGWAQSNPPGLTAEALQFDYERAEAPK